jgi:hypothetical protein
VDSINVGELQAQLPPAPEDEKSIAKLARWLQQEGCPDRDGIIATLRDLQALRSKAAAHRKGAAYETELTRILGALRGRAAIRHLLTRLVDMLESLKSWEPAVEGTAMGAPD